jgi:hypothetical protein
MRLLGWQLVSVDAFVGSAIDWLFFGGERVVEKMLLAYYLAPFPLFSGLWGSRMCLPCTFCWLVLWGAASWVVGASLLDRHSMAGWGMV